MPAIQSFNISRLFQVGITIEKSDVSVLLYVLQEYCTGSEAFKDRPELEQMQK
jgi:hypothetical protein